MLICCIHVLCDWWFHLCNCIVYICYFVALLLLLSLLWFSNFQFYFLFLTILPRVFIQNPGKDSKKDPGSGNVVIICILCIHIFGCLFCVIFFNHIDHTFQRRWAVPQSANFRLSYNSGLPGIFNNMFICPFLEHTQGSHYSSSVFFFFFINFFIFPNPFRLLFLHSTAVKTTDTDFQCYSQIINILHMCMGWDKKGLIEVAPGGGGDSYLICP